MGFNEIQKAIIETLQADRFTHELRASPDRNWLLMGKVDVPFVLRLVEATKGNEVESTPHHVFPSVTTWCLMPRLQGQRWYLKCYFKGERLWILSVHPAGMHPEGS